MVPPTPFEGAEALAGFWVGFAAGSRRLKQRRWNTHATHGREVDRESEFRRTFIDKNIQICIVNIARNAPRRDWHYVLKRRNAASRKILQRNLKK